MSALLVKGAPASSSMSPASPKRSIRFSVFMFILVLSGILGGTAASEHLASLRSARRQLLGDHRGIRTRTGRLLRPVPLPKVGLGGREKVGTEGIEPSTAAV